MTNQQDPTMAGQQDPNAGQQSGSDLPLFYDNQDGAVSQGQPGDDQPITEEQRAKIEELVKSIEAKYQGLNSMKFIADNKNQSDKIELLKAVFGMLEQAGVDPNDEASVNAFMEELKNDSPDLYELFVETMDSVLGDGQNTSDQGPLTAGSAQSEVPPLENTPGASQASGPGQLSNLMGQMPGGQGTTPFQLGANPSLVRGQMPNTESVQAEQPLQ